MSKEQVIKEAWGDLYDDNIEENGFKIVDNIEYIVNYQGGDWYCEPHTFETIAFMPKGLRVYLKNNGWIKIDNEDDLPKEEIDVHFIFTEYEGKKGRFQTYGVWDNNLKSFYSGALKINNVTHYQPIIKPKPPIY